MISYNEFKKIVETQLKEYMPEPYKSMKWESRKVEKVNQVLDGINFCPEETETKVAPTVYINNMYEQYKDGESVEEVLKYTANIILNAIKNQNNIIPELNFENTKDNIVFQLINTEQNKEMLKNIPHKEFLDLSVIYRWIVDKNDEGVSSIIVKDDMVRKLNLSEKELYNIAKENTKRINSLVIKPMREVLVNILLNDGMPPEMIDIMIPNECDINQYVITNEIGVNGASSLLYEEVLEELTNMLNSDLYIMPSSIHECIAVSTNDLCAEELSKMVESINMDKVELKDRLSNQVYLYDKETRKISVASINPNNI